MHYFRVMIAYKGTHYFGWQAQSTNTLVEEYPTVEGTILNALKKMSHYQPCTVSAASRTDGGVHAQGQVAKITLAIEINADHLLLGLNSLLPLDIRILECVPATKNYQPNRRSVSKEYHYYFATAQIDNVAISDIAFHLPDSNNKPVDINLLKTACQLFVGKNDFYNFSARDQHSETSVRQVFYCDILPANFSPLANDVYYLKIIGDGFLKYMIRYLMGALIELARERITLEDISRYLQQHQDDKLSAKAKAKGLHLIKIEESPN
ncbi:MAG: tRNA pseudouridine(38-40) synthase TruA [Oceanicoccus sp.]